MIESRTIRQDGRPSTAARPAAARPAAARLAAAALIALALLLPAGPGGSPVGTSSASAASPVGTSPASAGDAQDQAAPARGRIEWTPSLIDALARARSENKVVFIAINMDDERANDIAARELYRDADIVALSRETINVVANREEHRNGMRDCERFGGIPCHTHRRVDVDIRARGYVKASPSGHVIAPQHVWVAPDGKIIHSVYYQIFKPEMQWCFITALRSIHDTGDGATDERPDLPELLVLPADARPPQRLVVGAVFDPTAEIAATGSRRPGARTATTKPGGANAPDAPTRALTDADAAALIDELAALDAGDVLDSEPLRRLLAVESDEAVDFIATLLDSSGDASRNLRKRTRTIRQIGELAPPCYWQAIAPLGTDAEPSIRDEVAVALEQLAAPESARAIKAALRKEKIERIEKNWLRALGACAGDDSSARQTILKYAKSHKVEILRINGLIALGALADHRDIRTAFERGLSDASPDVRSAAACGAARTGLVAPYRAMIDAQRRNEQERSVQKVLDLALAILDESPGVEIAALIERTGQDEIARDRGR